MKITRSAIYVHRSNLIELLDSLEEVDPPAVGLVIRARDWAEAHGLPYEVVKYSPGKVSLISSPDWDAAPEPLSGRSYIWAADDLRDDGRWSRTYTGGRSVYHMKELFVSPDYAGFDVRKAEERTRMLSRLPPADPRRKGDRGYWEQYLRDNGVGD